MELKLIEKIKNSHDVSSFVFEPPEDLSWRAGQFITYTLPHKDPDDRGIERYFTIASAPYEKYVMITTRFDRNNGSSFKKALDDMQTGSIIEGEGPQGDFVIDKIGKKYVFLAGGIGVTPFRSIILDLANTKSLNDIYLLYGNRDKDIVYKNRLEKVQSENPGLKIEYVLSPNIINSELIETKIADFSDRLYYVSGSFGMVDAMVEILNDLGIPEDNISRDYFPGY